MGAGSESTCLTWPRLAWRTFAAGSRGPYAPPVLARGNVTDTGAGGGQARRENGIILSGGYLGGGRGRAPREKLLFHVTVILIRLPSSIASGFGGLFIFFA